MCEKVKVSIVMLIRDGEKYLAECLDSVLNQSMKEIEVICIDDASTDRSVEIIKTYMQRDCRIRSIFQGTKKGISQGRKEGVLISQGEYVLFVDGDGMLDSCACEELYREMKIDPVDILHFKTRGLECTGKKEVNYESTVQPSEPYMGRCEGDCVFEKCLGENIYSLDLRDKMYEGTLCRKAMGYIERIEFFKAQDKYILFVIAYFAQSYRGIDREYYTYQYNMESTNHFLNLAMFQSYCARGKIADAMERFIVEEQAIHYADILKKYRNQLLDDVLTNWMRVRDGQRAEAFDMILQYWNTDEVISGIAKKYWFDQGIIAQSVRGACSIKNCPRKGKVRTIGAYYIRLYGGGAQRVTAILANMWQSMGYQVVLFTDREESAEDYYLDQRIERVVIPSYESMKRENYGERARILEEGIKSYNIDVVVYHAWTSAMLLWDMLVCKLSGASFAVHCHNIFPLLMRQLKTDFAWQTKSYQLCDAVLTLSGTDRLFWQNFNSNVYEVRNPLFFDPAEINRSSLQGKNIVWIGRFSMEKHPEDALKIIKMVSEVEPGVKLYMLGEISEAQKRGYDDLITKMGIKDNVEITGYLTDISSYMQQASLQLITSEYEGFSLALLEGMAYGLPCVMYELPYLSLVQDNKSIVSVKYRDMAAAAAEILDLLGDTNKRKEMGSCADEYIKRYTDFSIEDQWREIFESLEQTHNAVDKPNLLMFNTLMDFYEAGVKRIVKGIQGDSLKCVVRSLLTRKTVFWGAGRRTHELLNEYPELNISSCIDNDRSRAGGNINGVPIIHVSDVKNWKELFIIITVAANAEIVVQLESYGLQYGMDYMFAIDVLT